jgi:hypothetical protein
LEEFRALRATIRQRGSLRFLVTTITFSAWAAVLITACIAMVTPSLTLISLVVLCAGFEVNLAIHVGVERVGRYLQVKYESEGPNAAQWERTSMALRVPSGGIDPLFSWIFVSALVLNWLMGVWLSEDAVSQEFWGFSAEGLVLVGLHTAIAARWTLASRFARSQRVRELQAFQEIHPPRS